MAEALRRQAKRDASKLQPIRKADAAETDEPDPPEGKISYALNIEDALREEMQTSPLTAETPETEPAAVAEDTEAMLEQAEASAAEEASPEGASDTMTEDAATASEAPAQEPTEQASAEPSDTTIPIPAPAQELMAQDVPEESYAGAAMLVLVPHRLDVLPFTSMSAPPDGVVFMPGFAGNVAEEQLRDARLSALATAGGNAHLPENFSAGAQRRAGGAVPHGARAADGRACRTNDAAGGCADGLRVLFGCGGA